MIPNNQPPKNTTISQKKLRVCMLAACPFPANHGTPGSIREMAEALVELNHDVDVVTYQMGEDIPVNGPQLHRIRALTREKTVVVGPTIRRPLYDLQMVFKAISVIRQHQADLIHAHGYEAALIAWICRMVTGKPVVYSAHNTMSDELHTYGVIRPRWVARALAKGLDTFVPHIGDHCIPHSKNIERFLHGKGLAHRCSKVIYKGIDVEAASRGDGNTVRQTYGLNDGPVILYAGVLDEFQRIDLLLDAMSVVLRSEPKARLMIVRTVPNPGQEKRLRDDADNRGIAGQVIFTESQTLKSVHDFIHACDIAVVPRPQAPGFAIKILNYMAAKKPCVLFDSSASGLVDGVTARLVSPDTGAAMGAAMTELINDPSLRERLAQSGYEYARLHRDRKLTAKEILAAYLKAIERRNQTHAIHKKLASG